MNQSNCLIKVLESQDASASELREAALKLGELEKENAIDSLLNTLEKDDEEVIRSAVWALGEIGEERATASLRRFFSTELDENIQMEVIMAASKIGGPRSELGNLVNVALISPYVEVRKRAVCEAGRNSSVASSTLKDMYEYEEDEEVQSLIVYSLGPMLSDFERLEFLVGAVEDGGKAGITAMWELDEIEFSTGEIKMYEQETISYLSHENEWVRKAAADALRYIDSNNLKLWEIALNESSEKVRESALKSLKISEVLDKTKITEENLNSFAESPNKQVRKEICSKIRSGIILEGKNVLLELVDDPSPEVRKEAVEALRTLEEQKFPGERYVHFWEKLPYKSIRDYGKSFDQEALEAISNRLDKEEDDEVLISMIHFAQLSGVERFYSKLKHIYFDNYNLEVRKETISAIGTTAEDIGELKVFLNGQLEERKDPEIHEALVETLGNVEDEETVNYLIEITENPETHGILRSAKDALSNINTEKAVKRLEELQESDEVDYEEYTEYRNDKIIKFTADKASNIKVRLQNNLERFKRFLKRKTWPILRRIPQNPVVTSIRKMTLKIIDITVNLFFFTLALIALGLVLALLVTIL